MSKILVIGSLNVDYVVNVDHMPAVGETILAGNFTLIPGGKGANQAFALGRMGADITMLGAVGSDSNGDTELSSLQGANVDTAHIARLDGSDTGIALISVNSDGNNSIVVVQGANKQVSKQYIESKIDVIKSADIVVLQLEIPMDTVIFAAKTAKAMGKTVILDPAPVSGPLPDELLAQVDVLKPNEIELAALTQMPDATENLDKACGLLLDKGVGCVLASLGSSGVYVAPKGEEAQIVPCQDVKVVDTTAAGDSFTAAIAFATAKGLSIFKAAEFANRIASIVVTRKGAQSSIPTKGEVDSIWSDMQ